MTGNYWLIIVGNYVRALFDKVQLRGWILTKNLQSLNLAELLFTPNENREVVYNDHFEVTIPV